MLFKKSERKAHTCMTLAIGALAVIGAVTVVKCGQNMARCASDKVSSMMRGMMTKMDCETCAD